MAHTYEVLVDTREYFEASARIATTRYEIDAESREQAHYSAWGQAKSDFPSATEHDIRVTRLLK